MKRRQHLLLVAAGAATALTHSFAQAQAAWPSKPIRLVVPFPAAGATDLFARSLAQKLGEVLGVSVIIDNKSGSGGAIGADAGAKAAPDGYTLLLNTSSTHAIGPAINPELPYDTVRDFTPIAHVGNAPSIMLVPNDSPAKTVQQWIDYAERNPGKLNHGSSGTGTVVHLTAELFKAQADVLPGFESNTLVRPLRPAWPAGRAGRQGQCRRQQGPGRHRHPREVRPAGDRACAVHAPQFGQMVAADAARWKNIIVERKITAYRWWAGFPDRTGRWALLCFGCLLLKI